MKKMVSVAYVLRFFALLTIKFDTLSILNYNCYICKFKYIIKYESYHPATRYCVGKSRA